MRRSPGLFTVRAATGVFLMASLALSCANSGEGTGTDAGETTGTGGTKGTGGTNGQTGGTTGATGGTTGTGGHTSGTGGLTGAGGLPATGGVTGTGGRATGGATGGGGQGTGGAGTGGLTGGAGSFGHTGGTTGAGGAGGAPGSGGTSGTGGAGGGVQTVAKFCGNITTNGSPRSDLATYWNQLTPENEGKWGSVQPSSQSSFNWGPLDNAYNYAKQHNMPFKQHNFVWGSQQPGWISGLSQANQKAAVENWIKAYCTRYPDTQMIDVVNEPPPHTTPPYTAALGGAGTSGYDWIAQAFTWAHQYCPNSILLINDYNTIEYAADNANIIKIVNAIKKVGAPIDGVGAQAHAVASVAGSSTSGVNTVKGYIDAIATQTGLPVYISEYDINVADDTTQKNDMQAEFTMFWTDPNVKGVTIWGYIEGATWETNSGLMSSSGTMRPAMTWLMQYLGR